VDRLAPWEFEFPFPGSLTPTFLLQADMLSGAALVDRDTRQKLSWLFNGSNVGAPLALTLDAVD